MSSPLKSLVVLHLVGNALLFGLGYWWLGVGESTATNLALSAALILVIMASVAWLHGTSLAYFRDPKPVRIPEMLIGPVRRLLPILIFLIAAVVIYFSLDAWRPLDGDKAIDVASYFTLKLQKPVRPATIQKIFDVIWWLIVWAIIPVLLLPWASGAASLGWKGYREFGARWKDWRFWLLSPVLLICAIWLPLKLITWTPMMRGFGIETASLIARFGLAYLLFVGSCLLLAFVTSRGKPSLNQPTTIPSP